jgi:hypothetical protein
MVGWLWNEEKREARSRVSCSLPLSLSHLVVLLSLHSLLHLCFLVLLLLLLVLVLLLVGSLSGVRWRRQVLRYVGWLGI